MPHITPTQQKSIRRAIKPATAFIQEKIESGAYATETDPHATPSNIKHLVAYRALQIAMLRSRRTWGSPAEEDALEYARTFIQ